MVGLLLGELASDNPPGAITSGSSTTVSIVVSSMGHPEAIPERVIIKRRPPQLHRRNIRPGRRRQASGTSPKLRVDRVTSRLPFLPLHEKFDDVVDFLLGELAGEGLTGWPLLIQCHCSSPRMGRAGNPAQVVLGSIFLRSAAFLVRTPFAEGLLGSWLLGGSLLRAPPKDRQHRSKYDHVVPNFLDHGARHGDRLYFPYVIGASPCCLAQNWVIRREAKRSNYWFCVWRYGINRLTVPPPRSSIVDVPFDDIE